MGLRILIVSDVYPPLIGGVDQQLYQLSKKLVSRGNTVSVCTIWQKGAPELEEQNGVLIRRFKNMNSRLPWVTSDPRRINATPFPDPFVIGGLRRHINEFKPEVIYAYGWIIYSCVAALVGKKIPLLLSVREFANTCALRTMMYYGTKPCSGPEWGKCLNCSIHYYGAGKGIAAGMGVLLGRHLLRWKVTGIHSVSTYMQKVIRRDLYHRSLPPGRPASQAFPDRVIPSFRDDSDGNLSAEAIRHYLDQLPDEPFILFVGALRRVKGIEPLMEAYSRLETPPQLVLIGVPSADTPQHFPPEVKVLYNFPHAAVMAAWERSLFSVAPSIWPDPFPNVIHEAMSKGKAVITTSNGGQTDMVIDGKTGLLVPPNDVEALRLAMQTLIDNPELRERLGRAGLERSKLFSSEVVVPHFEELYQEMVDNCSSRSSSHA